jgi:hypothetical protein
MKRFLVLIVLAMLVFWAVRSTHRRAVRHVPPPTRWNRPYDGEARREFASEAHRQAQQAIAEARHAIDEARHEVRQAWHQARDEMRQAYHEASDEVRQAYHEVLVAEGGQPPVPPPPPHLPPLAPEREEADGIPVPIVPGTRVTEAEARPPVPPHPVVTIRHGPAPKTLKAVAPTPPAPPAQQTRTVEGLISATEERAKAEARRVFRRKVVQWLDPEVPGAWTPPSRLLDAMVMETRTRPVVKDYGTLYVAELKVDLSPKRRTALVEAYNRELVRHRLATLGGLLAFVLICLAVISGYIRADEATKGYYTNRLRMLAAAGVGAGGAIIYNMVV